MTTEERLEQAQKKLIEAQNELTAAREQLKQQRQYVTCFQEGDVFLPVKGGHSPVVIIQHGYQTPRYGFAGLDGGVKFFSNAGKDGFDAAGVLDYLNQILSRKVGNVREVIAPYLERFAPQNHEP